VAGSPPPSSWLGPSVPLDDLRIDGRCKTIRTGVLTLGPMWTDPSEFSVDSPTSRPNRRYWCEFRNRKISGLAIRRKVSSPERCPATLFFFF